MSGRKPLGPLLVQHLEGSPQAKQRLEVILETLAGRLPVHEACGRLGIKPAMFHRIRSRVLEAGLADLEPRPQGRPAREITQEMMQIQQLQARIQYLEEELKLANVRLQVAEVLPHIVQPPLNAVKKTNHPTLNTKKPR